MSNVLSYGREITMGVVGARSASGLASDTVDLPHGVRALWISSISGGADIVVTLVDMEDGTSVTYTVPAAGRFVAMVKRLWSTGTTATVQNVEF